MVNLFVCTGLTSTTIPMYLAECSPSYLRGTLVSTNIAMVAFGQFMANVVDGIFGSDTHNGWRWVYMQPKTDFVSRSGSGEWEWYLPLLWNPVCSAWAGVL